MNENELGEKIYKVEYHQRRNEKIHLIYEEYETEEWYTVEKVEVQAQNLVEYQLKEVMEMKKKSQYKQFVYELRQFSCVPVEKFSCMATS